MKHKLFTLFLVLAASIGITNAAIVNGSCGDNLTWSLNTKDSTLTIEGSGKMTSWSAPSNVPWYEYGSYIAYISLPDGITSIGNHAFDSSCQKVTSLTIPNSVESIGAYAFGNFQSLTNLSIPNSVTSIGVWAFYNCWKMTSVIISESITSIGEGLFANCHSLTSVTIPGNVVSIGNSAFGSCYDLTTLTISSGVRSIEPMAFHSCSSLASVTFGNSIISIGNSAFDKCSSLTSIEIPNSVISIGAGAFSDCNNLKSVTIGNGITSIGNSAFSSYNLSSITCYATTPPSISSNTFYRYTIPVYVPATSIEAYQNAIIWEEFTNIQAIPAQNPVVTFKDWDGTILSSTEVEEGSAATPPADPTREGYTFTGWDKDFNNVTEDMVITALYEINHYQVNFVDWDGAILKSENVDYNNAATAPADPTREGYDFVGWDKSFDHVTVNMTVTATYEEGQSMQYHLTFVNSEDKIFDQEITVKVPAAPIVHGFTFVKWQIVEKDFVDSIIVEAIYSYNGDPTSAPAEVVNPRNAAQKLIREGNVYILHEGKSYSVQGLEVK